MITQNDTGNYVDQVDPGFLIISTCHGDVTDDIKNIILADCLVIIIVVVVVHTINRIYVFDVAGKIIIQSSFIHIFVKSLVLFLC